MKKKVLKDGDLLTMKYQEVHDLFVTSGPDNDYFNLGYKDINYQDFNIRSFMY